MTKQGDPVELKPEPLPFSQTWFGAMVVFGGVLGLESVYFWLSIQQKYGLYARGDGTNSALESLFRNVSLSLFGGMALYPVFWLLVKAALRRFLPRLNVHVADLVAVLLPLALPVIASMVI